MIRQEILDLYDEAVLQQLKDDLKTYDVREWSACGIDLSDKGELTKVSAAIRAGSKIFQKKLDFVPRMV